MKLKNCLTVWMLGTVAALAVSCGKDDDDNNPINNILPETAKLQAFVSGDYSDTLSISYNPAISSASSITATYLSASGELSILSVKPNLGGAQSLSIFAAPTTLATGTYNLSPFTHGNSTYFNNAVSTENFSVISGTMNVTKVETIGAGSAFENNKYLSCTFSLDMSNGVGDTIEVNGSITDAMVIIMN